MNKYQNNPECIIDLHGRTVREAKEELEGIVREKKYSHVRIITGKGAFRVNGPVLRDFVKQYLDEKRISYRPAKIADGGEGALEVFL